MCFCLSFAFLWLLLGVISWKISVLALAILAAIPSWLEYKNLMKKDTLLKQISELGGRKYYEVKLKCPRIAMMMLGGGKYTPSSYGIKIFDKSGKTYYYLFDDLLFYDATSIRIIHERFSGELTLQCYENSEIVQSVENDSFYIRVGNGRLI